MPTIPFTSVPRQSLQPLPGARLSPNAPQEAFGGGVASKTAPDLSGVADVAVREMQARQRIAQEAAAEADQVANTHSYSALTIKTNDILHGENGVLNRRGSDAFTADQDAYDRYGQAVAEIRATLGNDRQRAVFDKQALNEYNSVDNQVQSHIAAQRRVFDKQGTDALVEGKRIEAVRAYQDPSAVNDAIAVQQAALADFWKRQGAPDQEIENKKAEVESATRLQVLQQYIDKHQDQSAAAYLAKYQDSFVGRNLTQAESLVNRASIEGEAQRQSDVITGLVPAPPAEIQGPPGQEPIQLPTPQVATTLDDALKQAANIQDPRVRKETETRIRRHFADIATAERQNRAVVVQRSSVLLDQNGGNFYGIPAADRALLNPAEEASLKRKAESIRNPRKTTSVDVFHRLNNMASLSDSTRREFEALDLSKYHGSLSDADYKAFERKQATMREQDRQRAKTAANKKGATPAPNTGGNGARALDSVLHPQNYTGAPGGPLRAPAPSAKPPAGIDLRKPPEDDGNDGNDENDDSRFDDAPAPIVPSTWLEHDDADYQQYLSDMGVATLSADEMPRATPLPPPPPKPVNRGLAIKRDAAGRPSWIGPAA